MKDCPRTQQWDLFLADKLPDDVESSLELHLNQCVACQSLLENITNPSTMERVADFIQTLPQRSQISKRMLDALLKEWNDDKSDHPPEEDPLPEIPNYELHDLIGQGGSSKVYRASNTRLQRSVAIKILRDKCTPIQRQRFDKEAHTLAQLHHHNIASIIEVGQTAQHTYLVLEYISGGSLAAFLTGHAQPAPQAARLIQHLAHAIQKAHDTGFIHRDLKPGNILLDPHFGASETVGLDRFIPKIIDFGIVKDLQSTTDYTQTRDFVGTPSYMAPEQISQSKQPIDARTDVYALGIILYEMLTGRPPFRAASPIDTMLLIKHEEPVPPTRFEPKLNRDLENICLKCIEKDSASRYASTQHLADDLNRFLMNQPVAARPIAWPARTWRWSKRNPGWALAGLLIILILLALATIGPLMAHRERRLREEAAIERNRAQEHLDLAGQALEEMLDRFLTNMRLQDSTQDEAQNNLVSVALPYLERFVQEVDSAQTLKLRQARSLLQLAMLQVRSKEIDKAEGTYVLSLKQLHDLDHDTSISKEMLTKAQFSAHMEFARFLDVHRTQKQLAEQHYLTCLKLYDSMTDEAGRAKFLDSYAILHSLLGALLSDLPHRREHARPYVLKAVKLRHQLMEQHPDRDDLRHYAALAHMNLAVFHRKLKEHQDEINHLQLALDLENKVNQSKTIWIESPFFVSTLQGELGLALLYSGSQKDAIPHFKKANDTAQALTVAYPSVTKYQELADKWERALTQFDK